MTDRFKELMEKWDWKGWESQDKEHIDEANAYWECIDDLKDTLLLIEADKVCQTE